MYDRGGKTFAAPYRSLRSETYDYDSVFFGIRTRSDVFASFSVPRNGENCRGYVAYATSELADDYIISSWINLASVSGDDRRGIQKVGLLG